MVTPELRRFAELIHRAGFTGLPEVEIFSRAWWARPGDEVIATCLARYAACCRYD